MLSSSLECRSEIRLCSARTALVFTRSLSLSIGKYAGVDGVYPSSQLKSPSSNSRHHPLYPHTFCYNPPRAHWSGNLDYLLSNNHNAYRSVHCQHCSDHSHFGFVVVNPLFPRLFDLMSALSFTLLYLTNSNSTHSRLQLVTTHCGCN